MTCPRVFEFKIPLNKLGDPRTLVEMSLLQLQGIKARRSGLPDLTGLDKDIEALEWILANDKAGDYWEFRKAHRGTAGTNFKEFGPTAFYERIKACTKS